ncbi:SbcC/MukB-like Walker B domain-containing protein [Xanthomonas campestris]|uniref:SbcC/MukB-like Walker B domain-containing protein n=1 Tax=Xanthomonas campestris TaxID=339 RepID=UPI002B23EB40|nr:SbcC/MukB-like Walker B domain-containing protein [Xanthomonas campestris]MEA9757110.1 SbcC/MukB-like Walker B domain-containing protein [Xanthomonas campestris pv. raphani]MEA9765177.1 SbcC/MukB-like Walker B domain-containing protein [Xanthomonas campestris pv. raphani]MEA9817414.1 SbcC/MukB-like Walker B domain-containing protein [Xanthomonas campestris pv. raphani]MEA9910700.1 SbcC/MukB-like Walker B domain-containing protein [Xanthomonas campestris pv. raphani]MEA9926930.1 SbcC/MukB-li
MNSQSNLSPASPGASLFAETLAEQRAQQFRMRRLQVHNWGTFNGLTEVPIAEKGFLFVGRSGSGKSTLLDAMSALLTPPSIVDFNAAAREAERSGRDRSLVSYVRGAWADQQDSASGEIATQYLRKGATWTALVLEYRNAQGEAVSLVRLFWIAGSGNAAADVRRHYMVVPRAFDVASELEGFDLDLRKLKARLGEDVAHFDGFAGYAERFRHALGIGNDMALRLLHKTQSAKNLGDLNAFLRGFMLDEPRTFEAADRLVEDFAELDGAHHAVVTARRQVETLSPAREHHAALMALRRSVGELRELQLGVDSYREQQRLALLEARLQEVDSQDRGLAGEEGQRRESLDNHEQKLAGLEREQRAAGGEQIEELERERVRVERERDERLRRRAQIEQACRQLGTALAAGASGFAAQVAHAQGVLDGGKQHASALDEAIAERMGERRDDERRFAEIRAELDALKKAPSSMPAPMQVLRARLCDDTGIAESALPFVGELLQVREDQVAWRGAIERVLHGFAQSLLVDERHYAQVSEWVNRTHIGTRLVYFRVRRNDELHSRRVDPNALPGKLQLREHAFTEWLRNELTRRFDYACVDNAAALRNADRAITREGQVKHPGDRYEKDDRHAVNDRKRWLLGHDNRDKLKVFEREAQALAQRIASCDADVAALRKQREQDQEKQLAAHTLVERDWDEIDVGPKLQRLSDIDEQLQQLREGDSGLRALGQAIDTARTLRDQAKRTYEDVRLERAQLARERVRLEQQQAACAGRAGTAALTPTQMQGLQERLAALAPLSLDNLEAHFRVVERGLAEQLAESQGRDSRLSAQLLECFRRYCQQWPEDSGDFTVSLASADDFLARLDRLESDGLPRHEHRFFDLLQTQSKNNLLALQRHTAEAHKGIKQRMDEVNASLEQVPFNRDTILTIEVSDRRLAEVQEFQQQLRAVLSHQQTEDRALAEAQFATLRTLVARLGAQEPEARRWREQVLDVRLHVEFIGVELDAQSRAQVEIYRSGAGKSGGQRQKLATTCLAAALRYQLGGEDGELPRYCAVVLDEAFDKADNEFTALAMNIFENFGFQMVVATPLKSVMTLEPFIGGACFVEISGRHNSGVLLIEYDEQAQRLKLPERSRGEEAAAPPSEQGGAVAPGERAERAPVIAVESGHPASVHLAESTAVPAQGDAVTDGQSRGNKRTRAAATASTAAPVPAPAGKRSTSAAATSAKAAPATRTADASKGQRKQAATPVTPPKPTKLASTRSGSSGTPAAKRTTTAKAAAVPKASNATPAVAAKRTGKAPKRVSKPASAQKVAKPVSKSKPTAKPATAASAKSRVASTRGSAPKARSKR